MVIYLVRDPRALYALELPMQFKDSKLTQFPRIGIESIQRVMIFLYVNLEWIWLIITYKRFQNKDLLCRYEDLVNNPESDFRKIFEFCGVFYSDEFHKKLTVVGSSHEVDKNISISKHGLEKAWFNVLIKVFGYYE